jgi:hypothetical protein
MRERQFNRYAEEGLGKRSREVKKFSCGTDPIPGYGLPLRGFAITLIGHATLGRTPLDK